MLLLEAERCQQNSQHWGEPEQGQQGTSQSFQQRRDGEKKVPDYRLLNMDKTLVETASSAVWMGIKEQRVSLLQVAPHGFLMYIPNPFIIIQ